MLMQGFPYFWFLSGLAMLLPHFVCTFLLEKRDHFVIRSVIGILLFSVAAYFTCFTDQWNERYYLLLHLAGSLYLAFLSKLNIRLIVYFNIWCITLYYFVFQILSFANAALHIDFVSGAGYLSKIISLIVLVILEVLIIRSILSMGAANLSTAHVAISGLISASLIAFNTIAFTVMGQEGLTRYIFQIFSMLCSLLALYILVVAVYSQQKSSEASYIDHMWRSSKKDYELRSAYIDLINHKYHDLKHELRALKQMDSQDRAEYIDKLEHSIDQYYNLYQTGNENLDTILNDARRHCEKENIMFSCIANCSNIDFINVVDMHILLGNMLDNAVEAVKSLPEENRVVDLKLRTDEHFLRITEKNTFDGELLITKDGLATTKTEKGYHGFGSQSMKYIVDRYKGQMGLDTEGNVFTLHIVIPIPSVKKL